MPLVRELVDGLPIEAKDKSPGGGAWKAHLTDLTARIRAGDRGARAKMLGGTLHEDLMAALVPEICLAMTDDDENLRNETLLILYVPPPMSEGLINDHRAILASSSVARQLVVSAIGAALKERLPDYRSLAADGLGELGSLAIDARTALRDAISREPYPFVRSRMEAALRRIGDEALRNY
jgi:hypothetical protein